MYSTLCGEQISMVGEGQAQARTRYVAGCMTGTSLDGLDAAVVAIEGRGLNMRAQPVAFLSRPLGELSKPLRALAEQQPASLADIARIAHDFSVFHWNALRSLSREHAMDLIVVHGQTVYHAPPLSVQLMNPAPLAAEARVPVLHDLRAADLAMGGEGAPITPLADYILFRDLTEARAIVNLGGFCNITHLPRGVEAHTLDQIQGGDVCACNQLLDGLARTLLNKPYDAFGQEASRGVVVETLKAKFKTLLVDQSREGRSLGTGDELDAIPADLRAGHSAGDVLQSACHAVAETIAGACAGADRLILAGGGANNCALMAALRSAAAVPVSLSDEYEIPGAYREAIAMAVLGALCEDRVPITLPQITGARGRAVAGTWVLP